MDKKTADYLSLCDEVKNCTICRDIAFTPHIKNSDGFIHDTNVSDDEYVNRWNLLQGSLDAEIMVIGQDYGYCETDYFVTDARLKKLFYDAFSIEIDNKNPRLYFTNIANCYRKHKSTGNINKGCLALCANKFMSRLINVISPEVIIVLGQDTFNALACCDKAKLVCKNPTSSKVNDCFSTVLEFDYSLVFEDGKEIAVFPVYHPGAMGSMKRPYEEQLKDWKRISDFFGKNKKHPVRHHNMFGPAYEVKSAAREEDFEIYCHKEQRICAPKLCDTCEYFGGSEMGKGVCCIWEERCDDVSCEDYAINHDDRYSELKRVKNLQK